MTRRWGTRPQARRGWHHRPRRRDGHRAATARRAHGRCRLVRGRHRQPPRSPAGGACGLYPRRCGRDHRQHLRLHPPHAGACRHRRAHPRAQPHGGRGGARGRGAHRGRGRPHGRRRRLALDHAPRRQGHGPARPLGRPRHDPLGRQPARGGRAAGRGRRRPPAPGDDLRLRAWRHGAGGSTRHRPPGLGRP